MPRTDRPADQHDASRREFFRTFSRQTVHSAGSVIGAATELRRTGLEAARELMGSAPTSAPVGATIDPRAAEDASRASTEWSYRSAYRFTGDELVLLDQRELPGRIATIAIRDASAAASAIRGGVVTGGPVAGQIAAYAMVLAARLAAERSDAGRQQQVRAAAGTLRGARRQLHVVATAVDALEARYDAELDAGNAASGITAALQAEADRIAAEANLANAAIGRLAAELIAAASDGGSTAVQLLMHGDLGPLSCGMVGIGTSLLRALADAGRVVHVWVTEAGPSLEGSRISALQLGQNDVPHTVIPDSAVGWLLANRRIDSAVLRGDRLAANGDAGTIVGGLSIAQLAASAGMPVHLLAPAAARDSTAATGSDLRTPQSSAPEAQAERTAAGSDAGGPGAAGPGGRASAQYGGRLEPTSDVVPAELLTRIVTEAGVLVPPLRGPEAAR